MGRAKLPQARIEPRGVDGHLAQLKAEARQHARVAGAVGAFLARVLGWTAFAGATVAVLVWLAPPPSNPRLDDLKRIQADFQRSQANMEQARRAMEQIQRANELRLMEEIRQVPPMPTYDVSQLRDLAVPTERAPSKKPPKPTR